MKREAKSEEDLAFIQNYKRNLKLRLFEPAFTNNLCG